MRPNAVVRSQSAPGQHLEAEIAEQPQVLAGLLRDGAAEIATVAEQIRAYGPRFVLLAARGTSDHAALYAKYLTEVLLELPAGLASPSAVTVYGARPRLDGVLFVVISQSGRSPDLLAITTQARQRGALTVAVTNSPAAPLAAAARLHVNVRAGTERAVAATKSYTAQLLALYLLVEQLRGSDAADARHLPELAAAALQAVAETAPQAADRYRFATRLITTGRGYSLPSALEAALKLMETSYVSAQAFSAADLLHGPLAMVDPLLPVIAFVPAGRGGQALDPVLARLGERGADVLRVGPGPDCALRTPAGVPEALAPIVEILPLQSLALHLARARGQNPDAPRGLRKITETL
jgi:glucosamine--fructose-6-phosphate aminotransferase (isomerizing)